MPYPKFIFKHGAIDEIDDKVPGLDTKAEIEGYVGYRTVEAGLVAKKGLDRLNAILQPRKSRDQKKRWRGDPLAVAFFGDIRTVADIKAVRRRLERAHHRLDKHQLTIRLLPQDRASSEDTIAHNTGSFVTPNRFVLFPNWFAKNNVEQAGIIIHELLHDWLIDHKVNDGSKRVRAYGVRLAQKLAKDRPSAARRNPENIHQFCIAVWSS